MRPVGAEVGSYLGKAQGPAPSRRTSLHVVKAPVGQPLTHRRLSAYSSVAAAAPLVLVVGAPARRRGARAPASAISPSHAFAIISTPNAVTKSLTPSQPATTIGEEPGARPTVAVLERRRGGSRRRRLAERELRWCGRRGAGAARSRPVAAGS